MVKGKKKASRSPSSSPSPYCSPAGKSKLTKGLHKSAKVWKKTKPISAWTRFLRKYYCVMKAKDASFTYTEAMKVCGEKAGGKGLWKKAAADLGSNPSVAAIEKYVVDHF